MSTTWYVDDVGTLRVRFTSHAGNLTDPTTVTINVRAPAGNITTYTYSGGGVTKDATGQYSRSITFSAAGLWSWSVVSTGGITKTEKGSVRVNDVEGGL